MLIKDGKGRGNQAGVTVDNQLSVHAMTEKHIGYISREHADAYAVYVTDAGPVADEYTLYIKNEADDYFVVDRILTSAVSANVVWLLHQVSGTASGASVVTPASLNLVQSKVANLTCRGGAGGVADLTVVNTIAGWGNGVAYFPQELEFSGLVIGRGSAIAIEFDAGTSARADITVFGHFQSAQS
jgi:hypothetical protein